MGVAAPLGAKDGVLSGPRARQVDLGHADVMTAADTNSDVLTWLRESVAELLEASVDTDRRSARGHSEDCEEAPAHEVARHSEWNVRMSGEKCGAHGRTRTCGLRFRRATQGITESMPEQPRRLVLRGSCRLD